MDVQDAAKPCAGGSFASTAGSMVVLQKRRDFLAAARAKRHSMPGCLIQARRRHEDETGGSELRVGFTCSKKVGNAVARNRAKRRLRELARSVLIGKGKPGWDYVLIGRAEVTATRPYAQMQAELAHALDRLHPSAASPQT
ncbi:ribonuclease P protein component [Pseudoruegeria sp. SK021]|uniref:ribonuclease P protein component n=1 Tax=Pseudoruegeria sp. SK021 TaxID=1933035 RepID=UPI000A3296D2